MAKTMSKMMPAFFNGVLMWISFQFLFQKDYQSKQDQQHRNSTQQEAHDHASKEIVCVHDPDPQVNR